MGDGKTLWLAPLTLDRMDMRPGWGHNITLLDRAIYFDCAYLHKGVKKRT